MNIKAVASYIGLWLIGALVMAFALVGAVVVYDRVVDPTEDSGNYLLNCHVYGDGECGPNGPWHGFINLF